MTTIPRVLTVVIGLLFIMPSCAFAQAPSPRTVTLADAIKIAAELSPVLQSARDTYRLSQVQVDVARSPSRPLIALQGSSVRNVQDSIGKQSSTGINATLQQLLFDGGRVLEQIRSAENTEGAAAGTYERQAEQLAYVVAQAFYADLNARAALKLARDILKENQDQESLIRAQLQAGTASRVDLSTAHVFTAQAEVQLARAQGQAQAAQLAFSNVMGLHADANVVPAQNLGNASTRLPSDRGPLDYERAVARALLLRPDLLAARRTMDAARHALRAAYLVRVPELSATMSEGAASGTVPGGPLVGVNSVGISLAIPLYDQGVTHAQIEQSRVQLDQAQAALLLTQQNVELEVGQALATLSSARIAAEKAERELSTSQEVLSETREQYRAGVVQLLQLLNAQTLLTQAENDRLNAIYALRQAERTYLFAMGDTQT